MAIMNSTIEKKLWDAADALRTNSKLKSSEYATPVLGLIFLRFADYRFTLAKDKIDKNLKTAEEHLVKLIIKKWVSFIYLKKHAILICCNYRKEKMFNKLLFKR